MHFCMSKVKVQTEKSPYTILLSGDILYLLVRCFSFDYHQRRIRTTLLSTHYETKFRKEKKRGEKSISSSSFLLFMLSGQ